MGLQLIFVVEANKQCKSDWIYIKSTIEQFYQFKPAQIKLTPVYMDGKGNYKKKEKDINKLITQYQLTSKTNQSKVLFCFDCDDYDIKEQDRGFLEDVRKYCNRNGYDFIWFCKDIERVYIDKKVEKSQKKNEATSFKSKKRIANVCTEKLCAKRYRLNTSNIMSILDTYLERK